VTIGHIRHDGGIEWHAAIERRLLELAGEDSDLFATGQDERLAAAYRRRARTVAYRLKRATSAPDKTRTRGATVINKNKR
jgi:hypothetical protein